MKPIVGHVVLRVEAKVRARIVVFSCVLFRVERVLFLLKKTRSFHSFSQSDEWNACEKTTDTRGMTRARMRVESGNGCGSVWDGDAEDDGDAEETKRLTRARENAGRDATTR